MSLWAYVPEKTLAAIVPALPAGARRLDTGDWVTDVEKWANACGYWNADDPTVVSKIQPATAWRPALTNAEVVALIGAFTAARDRAAGRRGYVEAMRDQALQAVGVFHDWVDQVPPYVIPDNGPMPTGPDTLATLRAQTLWLLGRVNARDTYLHEHEVRLTQTSIQLIQVVFTLAQALLEEIERSETFVPPLGWLVE